MQPDPLALIEDLKSSGVRLRAVGEKRYLKSDAVFFGVTLPKTRKLVAGQVAEFKRRQDLTGAIKFSKVLWQTGVHEPRTAAIMLIEHCESFYDDRVWALGQSWLGELDNWALCDGVAPGLIAPFVQTAVQKHKSRRREVLRWTRDTNPWIRRGALLASILSTRIDREWEFVLNVAVRLREDPEYFVQKGLGWMLRECAHHNPREVIEFIQTHRSVMRRSTVTNAISRLPRTLQKAARQG